MSLFMICASVMVIVFSQVLSRQKRFFFSCCGVDLFQVVQDVEDVDDGDGNDDNDDAGCAAGPGPHHARPAHQPHLPQTQRQGRGGTEAEAIEDAEEDLII